MTNDRTPMPAPSISFETFIKMVERVAELEGQLTKFKSELGIAKHLANTYEEMLRKMVREDGVKRPARKRQSSTKAIYAAP